jgi:hypothetical protein
MFRFRICVFVLFLSAATFNFAQTPSQAAPASERPAASSVISR